MKPSRNDSQYWDEIVGEHAVAWMNGPGRDYRFDFVTWIKHCRGLAKEADSAGFPDQAQQIRDIIDEAIHEPIGW